MYHSPNNRPMKNLKGNKKEQKRTPGVLFLASRFGALADVHENERG